MATATGLKKAIFDIDLNLRGGSILDRDFFKAFCFHTVILLSVKQLQLLDEEMPVIIRSILFS